MGPFDRSASMNTPGCSMDRLGPTLPRRTRRRDNRRCVRTRKARKAIGTLDSDDAVVGLLAV
jgi:hypothetical protein